MKNGTLKSVRCAIYTRVSTDHGLEQDFNSLDAQHDAAQADFFKFRSITWLQNRAFRRSTTSKGYERRAKPRPETRKAHAAETA